MCLYSASFVSLLPDSGSWAYSLGMNKQRESNSADPAPESDLPEAARQPDAVLSLEGLSKAFAEMLETGDDSSIEAEDKAAADSDATDPSAPSGDQDDGCPITPRSILEAVLFVGSSDHKPLPSEDLARLMRDVSPAEINQLVRELNQQYESEGRPYHIVNQGAGYRMLLRDEYSRLRDKFYGRIKRARLSQAAIEVLSIVVYNEPLTGDEINKLRDKPSASVLSQLLRRQLLRIERVEKKPRQTKYFTTDRFLKLFGLNSRDDLPRPQEMDNQ